MERKTIGVAILAACAWLAVSVCSAGEEPPDGKALYVAKCASCHGKDGVANAMGKGSANFNDPGYTAGVEEIVKVTLDGKNKMPAYAGKLTPAEVKAIAEYMKTLRPRS